MFDERHRGKAAGKRIDGPDLYRRAFADKPSLIFSEWLRSPSAGRGHVGRSACMMYREFRSEAKANRV